MARHDFNRTKYKGHEESIYNNIQPSKFGKMP